MFVVIPSDVEESLNSIFEIARHDRNGNKIGNRRGLFRRIRTKKHIGDIARRTRKRLDHVLVVDDDSTDETGQRAREAGAEVIVHDQNQGKGEAIKTGLAHWLRAANPSSSGQDRQIA